MKYFWIVLFVFLVVALTACAPAQIATEDIQNTAIAIVQTGVALTQTALPPTLTPTATFVYPTPSPIPTLPPIGMTPDPTQVEGWKEYQTELAKVLLYDYGPDAYKDAVCEWDILGSSEQEVYVWAWCVRTPPFDGHGSSGPAVIYLHEDKSIEHVEVPGHGSTAEANFQKMFPEDIREKLELYYFNVCVYCGRPEELRIHLLSRQTHPEEPPLIVLGVTPMP